MSSYYFSPESYCKILLHAVKYPHKAVNGVLIGRQESANTNRYNVTDAIPLFHNALGVTPMLEVALAHTEAYCRLEKLTIVGYYQANEGIDQDRLDLYGSAVGQKIQDNFADACVVLVSNKSLVPHEDACSALKLYVPDNNRGWKEASSGKLLVEEGAIKKYHTALGNNLENQLVDFDNYLDSPTKDWLNRALFTGKSVENMSPKTSPKKPQ